MNLSYQYINIYTMTIIKQIAKLLDIKGLKISIIIKIKSMFIVE